MAKKKSNAEKSTELSGPDAGSEVATAAEAEAADDGAIVEVATPGYVAAEELWLVAEVQAFLSRRGELAEKLAREIEATELKLAELKRTAALLSPTAAAPPEPAKKAKKPMLKKVEKKAERKSESGTDAPANSAAGAQTDDAAQPAA